MGTNYEEYRKRILSGDERKAIFTLDMLCGSFDVSIDILKNRLKDYKYLKRDLGQLKHIIKNISDHVLKDVPEDIKAHIRRQSRDFTITTERVSPIHKGQELVMPVEHVWQLTDLALSERCGVCVKTAAECKACKLRKVLRLYVDEPDPEYDNCGYMLMRMHKNLPTANDQKLEI